ncbi:MAG: hypothetical protein Q4D62_05450 [Planctomycetia bacterium]|nr:hypothetical protein [Planctomycetia bacterium]
MPISNMSESRTTRGIRLADFDVDANECLFHDDSDVRGRYHAG